LANFLLSAMAALLSAPFLSPSSLKAETRSIGLPRSIGFAGRPLAREATRALRVDSMLSRLLVSKLWWLLGGAGVSRVWSLEGTWAKSGRARCVLRL
jgi:uncharacterized protein involved in cysteine biosynthesis